MRIETPVGAVTARPEDDVAGPARSRADATPDVTPHAHMVIQVLLGLMVALSLAFAIMPSWRIDVGWPAGRQPIGAFGASMSLLTSALAYVWHSFEPSRRTLYVSVAFLVLGVNQLTFGIIIPAVAPSSPVSAYILIASRVVTGVLLVIGGLGGRRHARAPKRPLVAFLAVGLGGLVVLGIVQRWIWVRRDTLPRLCCGPNRTSATLLGAALCIVGVSLYLAAAFLFLRRPGASAPPHGDWLSAALLLNAFGQLHYFLLSPALLPEQIAASDFLRIAQFLVLFFGLTWEVRLLLEQERDRTVELSALHAARDEAQRILSHDLLHSIATLTTFTSRLVAQWDGMDPAAHRDSAARIDRQSLRLAILAEDTQSALSMAPGAVPLSMRPEAVSDVVQAVVEATGSLQERLEVRVDEVSANAVVNGNMLALGRVLLNLVWNAEEYSSPDSPIVLDVTSDHHIVTFTVVDRGSGFPGGSIDDLLERTPRAAAVNRGIGLTWSRSIVEAHGGDISASSRVGEGSSFAVRLPRWSPASV